MEDQDTTIISDVAGSKSKATTPFSKLPEQEKLAEARARLRHAVAADSDFQQESREDFRFHAGDQWDQQTLMKMKEEGRPALTFNLIKTSVDLVLGVNENNRTTVSPEPTEDSDQFLCDILKDADDYCSTVGSFEDQEDDAFENSCICGRGFVGMDVEPDPERLGEIILKEVSIPVPEIRMDPAGKQDDLSDHRFIFWDKWLTFEDFAIRYPAHAGRLEELLEGYTVDEELLAEEVSGDIWDQMDTDSETSDYDQPLDFAYYDKSRGRIRVVHMEYWDTYQRFYGFNPMSGKTEEFNPQNLPALEAKFPGFEYVTLMDKKVKWFQFIGDQILFDGDSPIPYRGFSICACFAYKDKSHEQIKHFGLVRLMKDPQREVNKRWSQTLHLLMKQGAGGYFAEIGAPTDKDQWKASVHKPGATTWVSKGSIASAKFKEKSKAEFPMASMKMEEYAADVMKKISGINPDLLGMDRGREDAGVVIRLRQQQGLVLLARLFKSFKRMKRQIAERRFAMIMRYMPDEQLSRILGNTDRYVFRQGVVADRQNGFIAPLRTVRDLQYNVKAMEAPGNMTKRMGELAVFMEMMQNGFPVDPMAVVEKLDLPGGEKARWIKYIQQQQQSQQQMQMQQIQEATQEKMGKLQNEQTKHQVSDKKADIQAKKNEDDRKIRLLELQQAEREDRRDYAIDIMGLQGDEKKMIFDLVAKLKAANNPTDTKAVANA